MAALLVSVAVMGVLMSVAMPVWRHQAQREKEEELVFRGEQWVKGLQLWQRKNGPGSYPPSLDVLVQGRFVRKKWKDPITGEDFVPRYMGQQPTQPGGGQGRGGAAQPPTQPAGRGGGIMGVYSKSTETSIRQYKGATRYDQWQFIAQPIGGPGIGGRGRGTPGGQGVGMPGMGGRGRGRGGNEGGRGPRGGGPGRGRGGGPGRGGAIQFPRGPGG